MPPEYVSTSLMLTVFSLIFITSFFPVGGLQGLRSWRYFEYPTETWIVERQDYFGKFLQWDFVPVDGQHSDKRVWNFSWRHVEFLEVYNETVGELVDVVENPVSEIRLALDNETWLREIYDKTEPLWFKTWGDFKSDVARLDKYPIVPEDKEEFTGLRADIDILNFDNGSFSVGFRDRWKPGKKIAIGFGSTITYSGATNTITCTGGTEESPIGFWDLWNASDSNGWGQVNNTCNMQFKFWCKIQVGDASTLTWFKDQEKQVLFDANATSASYEHLIRVTRYAHFILGILEDEARKSTSRGVDFIALDNQYGTYIIAGQDMYYDQYEIYLYSCSFDAPNSTHFLGGNWWKARYWNLLMTKSVSLTLMEAYGANYYKDVFNVHIQDCGTAINYAKTPGITVNKLYVTDSGLIIYTHATYDFLLENVYSRGTTYTAQLWTDWSGTGYFVNPDIDTWAFSWHAGATGEVYRQYTFDLTVTFPNGTAIENANVTLSYHGQGGAQVGSWLTDSNGEIPQQTLTMGFYNQTGGDTIYSYNPYQLEVTNATGYQDYTKNFTLSEKTDWTIALQEEGGGEIRIERYLGLLLVALPVGLALFGLLVARRKTEG